MRQISYCAVLLLGVPAVTGLLAHIVTRFTEAEFPLNLIILEAKSSDVARNHLHVNCDLVLGPIRNATAKIAEICGLVATCGRASSP